MARSIQLLCITLSLFLWQAGPDSESPKRHRWAYGEGVAIGIAIALSLTRESGRKTGTLTKSPNTMQVDK